MCIFLFRLICFPLLFIFQTNYDAKTDQEPDDCSRTSHSFRPPVHHAKYPSCVTCAAADGSTRDTSGSERACPGELPPWHGNLRDLPTYSVRYFPFPTKKSVDLFCSFTPIHYLCKCGDTQIRQDVSFDVS